MYKKLKIGVGEYIEKIFIPEPGDKEKQEYLAKFRGLPAIVIYGAGV